MLLQPAQQAVIAAQRRVHARVLAGEADLVAAAGAARVHRVRRRQRGAHAGDGRSVDGSVIVRVLGRPLPLRRRVAGPTVVERGCHAFAVAPVWADARTGASGMEHRGLLLLQMELRELVLRRGVGGAIAVEDARARPPVVHLL